MSIKKIIKILNKQMFLIIILLGVIFVITQMFFKEKMDKPWIEEFEEVLKEDIVKVVIYCDREKFKGYKMTIEDKSIISELKKASTFDYGTKAYSGSYLQEYAIQLQMKDGKKYMYGFSKTFTPRGDYCRKSIEYEGKLYHNPYNDCGQMFLYVKSDITEAELIKNSFPIGVVSGYNLKLIGFIEKYADSASFDGKNKIHFYNRFEIDEIKNFVQSK